MQSPRLVPTPIDAPEPPPAALACWSCGGPTPADSLFCVTCAAVQPPGAADHFRRLGLQRSFELERANLERRYFDLQRRLHPDRFATRTGRERALSQAQAVSLNDAYRTLADPLARAVYLLHLGGMDVLAEGCNQIADPVILMEAMEMREALAAAQSGAQVALFAATVAADIEECVGDLAVAFRKNDLDEAAKLTTRLRYLRKLIEDSRARHSSRG
ncbi:MAG: Fe-S protein assembly co-chaperone HscB [Rhodospirillales bacterium]|nr:Fe-S protein assembly co-chaperone HscB [Rhodospirillales bacterium]MSP81322.1 Fe-S protein assembly co-chaperone HscB [Rhodospirillales bacterium]